MNRELTPYLSGDRFLYVRGDFRRVLHSMISINNKRKAKKVIVTKIDVCVN